MSLQPTPTLLLPREYIASATKQIAEAKTKITLVSLILSDDDTTRPLIDALCAAASRGVDVQVAADSFTYGELAGHFIPTRYFSKAARQTNQMVNRLRKCGVNFHWLGVLSQTPFSGRTHLKWLTIDETAYSFGGVNTYQLAMENTDYMLKIKDSALVSELEREFQRLIKADKARFSFRSRQAPSSIGTVLIDGGMPFDSVIYRRARQLASQSSKIILVSQYAPTGSLARRIRKVPHAFYFNRTEQADRLNRLMLRAIQLLSNINTSYTRQPYLHAKYILFYREEAPTIALTGSHNFVRGGTIAGTREIALETTNLAIVEQLERFTSSYVD